MKVEQAIEMCSFTASEITIKYVKMSFVYGEWIYYICIKHVGFLCLHIACVMYYISFSLCMVCKTATVLHIAESVEILQMAMAGWRWEGKWWGRAACEIWCSQGAMRKLSLSFTENRKPYLHLPFILPQVSMECSTKKWTPAM